MDRGRRGRRKGRMGRGRGSYTEDGDGRRVWGVNL